jgi:hypothetical protein
MRTSVVLHHARLAILSLVEVVRDAVNESEFEEFLRWLREIAKGANE